MLSSKYLFPVIADTCAFIFQDEITRALALNTPGGSVSTAFSAFPSPQLTKVIKKPSSRVVVYFHKKNYCLLDKE